MVEIIAYIIVGLFVAFIGGIALAGLMMLLGLGLAPINGLLYLLAKLTGK